MNQAEIVELVNKDPFIAFFYEGSFAIDKVPCIKHSEHFALVNSDRYGSIGSHWYVVYKASRDSLEIFDPLGRLKSPDDVLVASPHLLKDKTIRKVRVSEGVFQPPDSQSCAQFAIYFITRRIYRMSETFETVLKECFTKNVDHNEKRVQTFISELEKFHQTKQEIAKQREAAKRLQEQEEQR